MCLRHTVSEVSKSRCISARHLYQHSALTWELDCFSVLCVSLTCSCSEEVLTSWPALQLYCSRRLSLCTIRFTSSSSWLKNFFSCGAVFAGFGSWHSERDGETERQRGQWLMTDTAAVPGLLRFFGAAAASSPFTQLEKHPLESGSESLHLS